MKIILIAGKAGSGKNEVAKIIKDNLDKTIITSCSKYIKLFAHEMIDWNYDEENKPREFLQNIGDELRNIRKDFLTKRILEDIELYQKYYNNLIISDIRLKNEIEYFKNQTSHEVITIKVTSDIERRNLNTNEKNHLTELD